MLRYTLRELLFALFSVISYNVYNRLKKSARVRAEKRRKKDGKVQMQCLRIHF